MRKYIFKTELKMEELIKKVELLPEINVNTLTKAGVIWGKIKKNKIYIGKTSDISIVSIVIGRRSVIYFGEIVKKGDELYICGRFSIPTIYKMMIVATLCLLTLVVGGIKQMIISSISYFAILYILKAYYYFISKTQKKDIIEFIKNHLL